MELGMRTIGYIALSLAMTVLGACERAEQAITEEKPASVEGTIETAQAGTPMVPRTSHNYFPVKRCMNVGNALEAENEGDWGYRIEQRHLQEIAMAGFDTIRLPIRWDTHTDTRPPYRINPAHMERVKQVVGQAQAAGLGVIIDVHHYESLMDDTAREAPRFMAIWDQIAQVFRTAPETVYFELLNEPTNQMSMETANRLYAEVLPIIRNTNPIRPVIIGGNSWNSVDTLDKVRWPRDPYLVATFHDYGPHEFTHQGAEWIDPKMPMGRKWGGREDIDEFRETYTLAANFQKRTGLPVFVGEFGVISKVPLRERADWIKTRRKRMEQAGYSWCAWDLVGAFQTYDKSRERWLPGMQDALMSR